MYPKLNEVVMIQSSYMQLESEILTHIVFLVSGQADFVYRKKFSYYTVPKGGHFGVEDIYFRVNQMQVEFAREEENRRRERQE